MRLRPVYVVFRTGGKLCPLLFSSYMDEEQVTAWVLSQWADAKQIKVTI